MHIQVKGLRVNSTSLHEYLMTREETETKRFTFRFAVVGSGQFPIDMLRRDGCFPETESDSSVLQDRDRRTVVLIAHHQYKTWVPTFDRWRSFGWSVMTTAHKAEIEA
jgi:hypothetical protein